MVLYRLFPAYNSHSIPYLVHTQDFGIRKDMLIYGSGVGDNLSHILTNISLINQSEFLVSITDNSVVDKAPMGVI